jgi:hypothetical protein
MKKHLVLELHKKAESLAKAYSKPGRENNHTNELFSVHQIKPLSEDVAAIIFKKCSGKFALLVCFWINANDGYWHTFFPKDSHLLGMRYIEKIKLKIEEINFGKN